MFSLVLLFFCFCLVIILNFNLPLTCIFPQRIDERITWALQQINDVFIQRVHVLGEPLVSIVIHLSIINRTVRSHTFPHNYGSWLETLWGCSESSVWASFVLWDNLCPPSMMHEGQLIMYVGQKVFSIHSFFKCIKKILNLECILSTGVHTWISSFIRNQAPTMIKVQLLPLFYGQLWVVEFGEIGRWSLVGVRGCPAIDSLNTNQRFSWW